MEFTCNIESTSHSLDPADRQQKVNIIIYSPYRFPQILVDSPLGTSGRKNTTTQIPASNLVSWAMPKETSKVKAAKHAMWIGEIGTVIGA
jgi:hypothetical protein